MFKNKLKKKQPPDLPIGGIAPFVQSHPLDFILKRFSLGDTSVRGVIFACFSVVCAYLLSEGLRSSITYIQWRINVQNFTAFFLIACVVTALRHGLFPGIISAILGFSVVNYYYVPPLNEFGIEYSANSISLAIFLFSAFSLSFMGSYSRANNRALVSKERRSHILFQINRIANEASTKKQALLMIHAELEKLLKIKCLFLLRRLDETTTNYMYPETVELNTSDRYFLDHSKDNIKSTGRGITRKANTSWRFEPMVTSSDMIGVMGILIPKLGRPDSSFNQMVTAISLQVALIMERMELTDKIHKVHIATEKEQLRSMLLSSVSHDLKTPLASIIGSLNVYERMKNSQKLTAENANELLHTARQEAERLDSFITNILDMTRIESGDINFSMQWVNSYAPVENILKRLHSRLGQHNVMIDLDDRYDLMMDQTMTEQVLQNVLDNAVKYSQGAKDIHVYCDVNDGYSYIIKDFGKGIADDKLEAVFDKYERIKHTDSTVAGTGLGLAICKAVMEKQGGTIIARNHADGGAEFVIKFSKIQKQEALYA